MVGSTDIAAFLSHYDDQVSANALKISDILLKNLPNVTEQLDVPAKMIAYCYGQKYAELVCTIIPSRKGLKLGFYKGIDLPDPNHLLKGNGKISRYVEIKVAEDVESPALKALIKTAFETYKARNGKTTKG